jgi:hypothetical protein
MTEQETVTQPQACREWGISPNTFRARYKLAGLPPPLRDRRGIPLYLREHVEKLREMFGPVPEKDQAEAPLVSARTRAAMCIEQIETHAERESAYAERERERAEISARNSFNAAIGDPLIPLPDPIAPPPDLAFLNAELDRLIGPLKREKLQFTDKWNEGSRDPKQGLIWDLEQKVLEAACTDAKAAVDATLQEYETALERACAVLAPLFQRRAALWQKFTAAKMQVDASLRANVPEPLRAKQVHHGLVVQSAQAQSNAALAAAVGAVNTANEAARIALQGKK